MTRLVQIVRRSVLCLFLLCIVPGIPAAQPPSLSNVRSLVLSFKQDERGPYQSIRWFCPDGTNRPANQPCGEPGSIQHALHKDIVQRLAKEQGIYLGQILAGTPVADFIDAANQNTRLKQYQMEQFLQTADDGWILRRARYYRGAVQAEDENAWGLQFLQTLVQDKAFVTSKFFLLKQISKDIPHQAEDNRWDRIRADSKTISDELPSFMPIRIKIHGQPDVDDIKRIDQFLARNQSAIAATMTARIRALRADLDVAYQQASVQALGKYTNRLPAQSSVAAQLAQLIRNGQPRPQAARDQENMISDRCNQIADLLLSIRLGLLAVPDPALRVTHLDLSNDLERLLFTEIGTWQPGTLRGLLAKQYTLAKATAGSGFLELWEWEHAEPVLRLPDSDEITVDQFLLKAEYGRHTVDWSTNMVRAEYQSVITLFEAFEPLAKGFLDDRIRASIILRLGQTVSTLADRAKQASDISNHVLSVSNPNQIRGLNPGYAVGQLKVVTGSQNDMVFDADKIYVLNHAPADMKPVAGIMTVASGNLVSHVQLLARNLGIPNADILQTQLPDFSAFDGQRVFYAVSPRGTVIMKPTSQMTSEEKALIAVKARSEEKISVPDEKIDIRQKGLLPLREIKATDSGIQCGPKAANAGQLKQLFPEQVIDGIVVSFGIFREHMDQPMPGQGISYWEFLQTTFSQAANARARGISEADVERAVLSRLTQLREAIRTMPLLASFTDGLTNRFFSVFGVEMGYLSVFIRSDTNMEDLKDFTGAGLNLTVFNVRKPNLILQAIRDVWASPYTERSYRWRQKYLLNPEAVYPSILIMPTINVDKSGVMITSGVSNGDPRDITVAFSRGPGGAVEGQATELYLLRHTGETLLLSPSRETQYNILPVEGGLETGYTHFSNPILTKEDIAQLRTMATAIQKKLPGSPGIETEGPFDVELGFRAGKLWLFQVRPYVENKQAKSSQYLQSLDPQASENKMISLSEPIN